MYIFLTRLATTFENIIEDFIKQISKAVKQDGLEAPFYNYGSLYEMLI